MGCFQVIVIERRLRVVPGQGFFQNEFPKTRICMQAVKRGVHIGKPAEKFLSPEAGRPAEPVQGLLVSSQTRQIFR